MSPQRQLGNNSRSVPRMKSVIVKPPQTHLHAFRADSHSASQMQNRAAKSTKSVVIEGQSGVDQKFIRVKIEGTTKIDHLDAMVTHDTIVSELLPRLRHSCTLALSDSREQGVS